jgi:flagellar basal-body rod protein FlgB
MAMAEARLAMKATNPAHMVPAVADGPATRVQDSDTWDVTHSGNSVSMEQELIKAGEVNRAFRLNTSVAQAFHRMMLASAKV